MYIDSGVFTMSGGSIHDNLLTFDASEGGGVFIGGPGKIFNLNSPATTGSIYNNRTDEILNIPKQVGIATGGTFNINGSPGSDY